MKVLPKKNLLRAIVKLNDCTIIEDISPKAIDEYISVFKATDEATELEIFERNGLVYNTVVYEKKMGRIGF